MYTQVGQCPKCGSPIYAPSSWMGVTPPPSKYSCSCNLSSGDCINSAETTSDQSPSGMCRSNHQINTDGIKLVLRYLTYCLSAIRGDWTDPRWHLRECYEAIDRIRELMGEPPQKPYRHDEDTPMEAYLERLHKTLTGE